MEPYRPIDLDLFNKRFFENEDNAAGEASQTAKAQPVQGEKTPVTARPEKSVFTQPETESEKNSPAAGKTPVTSVLTPDVIEAIRKIDKTKENPVFHLLDDVEKQETGKESDAGTSKTENVKKEGQLFAPSKRKPQMSEAEALQSFPDFKFDPSVFENEENDDGFTDEDDLQSEEYMSRENLQKLSKRELKAAKKQLKLQRKYKAAQKPSKLRRFIIVILVLALFCGLLASAASQLLRKAGTTPQTASAIFGYTLLYVDGKNTVSSELNESIVLYKSESVSSSSTIVFSTAEGLRAEKIIAIGNGVCAVTIDKHMSTIQTDDVIGVVHFSIRNIGRFYRFSNEHPLRLNIGFVLYYLVVIVLFSIPVLMKRRTSKYFENNPSA